MINQHLQAAITELQEFIDDRPDAREVRKALAVKLVYQGYKYEEIQTILDVSLGSIDLLHECKTSPPFKKQCYIPQPLLPHLGEGAPILKSISKSLSFGSYGVHTSLAAAISLFINESRTVFLSRLGMNSESHSPSPLKVD